MIKAIYIIILTCVIVLAQLPDSVDTQKVADNYDTTEYHYFVDNNKNGIDDRLEQKLPVKQSTATDDKDSKYREQKDESFHQKSYKKLAETKNSGKKQNNQQSRPPKRR